MSDRKFLDTRKLVSMALLCALAYTAVVLSRMLPPITLWLKYDPKDCILAIGGMLYDPLSAVLMSVVVSFVEYFTVSDTGLIGMLMNILSSLLFILPAAFLYRRRRTLSAAVVGLIIGVVLATGGMLLWNWFISPLYTGWEREAIEELLLPAFLPFNLLKTSLNAVLTVLLYKHVVSALRAAHLVPKSNSPRRRGFSVGVVLSCLFLLASLILVWLVWCGVL